MSAKLTFAAWLLGGGMLAGGMKFFDQVEPAPSGGQIAKGDAFVPTRQKITTYLWFDNNAEEAVRFYTSIFKNSEVVSETRVPNPETGGGTRLLISRFRLEGQEFMALNGGPLFKFNEAISLFVDCKDQAEVDELWSRLTADGGEESRCGWLKDKFGLSWQIIPGALMEMMSDKDPARVKRVTEAMLQMNKFDIAKLRAAFEKE